MHFYLWLILLTIFLKKHSMVNHHFLSKTCIFFITICLTTDINVLIWPYEKFISHVMSFFYESLFPYQQESSLQVPPKLEISSLPSFLSHQTAHTNTSGLLPWSTNQRQMIKSCHKISYTWMLSLPCYAQVTLSAHDQFHSIFNYCCCNFSTICSSTIIPCSPACLSRWAPIAPYDHLILSTVSENRKLHMLVSLTILYLGVYWLRLESWRGTWPFFLLYLWGKKINFILVYVARNWHCFIVGRGDWFLYDDDNNNNKIKR
jgi:hypothetical protein